MVGVQVIEWTEESAVNIYSRSVVSTYQFSYASDKSWELSSCELNVCEF